MIVVRSDGLVVMNWMGEELICVSIGISFVCFVDRFIIYSQEVMYTVIFTFFQKKCVYSAL